MNSALAAGTITVVSNLAVYQSGSGGVPICSLNSLDPLSRITWDGSFFDVVPGKADHPMVTLTWFGCCTYANRLSLDNSLTPCYDEVTWICDYNVDGFRLPTEAEWEYAARGAEYNPYYAFPWGDMINGSQANFKLSGDPYEAGPNPQTTPVEYYDGNQVPSGVDMANGYGLYSMTGNVLEWCGDWYESSFYSSSPTDQPMGPATGVGRVVRGASWDSSGDFSLRTAKRSAFSPFLRYSTIGFRVAAKAP